VGLFQHITEVCKQIQEHICKINPDYQSTLHTEIPQ